MAITSAFPQSLRATSDGEPTGNSVTKGDLLEIIEESGGWSNVKVVTPGGSVRTGWIETAGILPNYEPKFITTIDDAFFASDCMSAARFFGANAHFLLAWADIASQIKNDKVESGDWIFYGPFRFSTFTWGRYRVATEFGASFGATQLHDPYCQCDVAGVIAGRALTALEEKLGAGNVDATSLAFAVLLGTPAALKGLEQAESKLTDLISASYPTDKNMLKEVTLRLALLEAITNNTLADKTVTKVLALIAAALNASLEKTKPLIMALDPEEFPLVADSGVAAEGADALMAVGSGAAIYGHLVKKMQDALNQAGAAPALTSMIFDAATLAELNRWRQGKSKAASNAISVEEWMELTGQPQPDDFDLCAQVTAAFEGHGFGDIVNGDSDGAILTWGYHGFTFKFSHVQNILALIEKADAGMLTNAFGAADADVLRGILAIADREQQLRAGKESFLVVGSNSLKPNWDTGFRKLGKAPGVDAIQLAYSRSEFWKTATGMAAKLGLKETLSLALCFDIAIQNGPKGDVLAGLKEKFPAGATELDKRRIVADMVIGSVTGAFKEDTRARKTTIATGAGQVHGKNYDLSPWGLAPLADEGLSEPDDLTVGEPVSNTSFEAWFKSELPDVTSFKAREFLAKGSNAKGLNTDPPTKLWRNMVGLARLLQKFKDTYAKDQPVLLHSVYRSPEYNSTLNGAARKSQHMAFRAADVSVPGKGSPQEWARVFRKLRSDEVFSGGIGLYRTFVHVDVRGTDADW